MSSRQVTALISVLSVLMLSATVLSVTDDSSATSSYVNIADMGGDVTIKAGQSTSFDVIVTNYTTSADEVIVQMSASVRDGSGNTVRETSVSISVTGPDKSTGSNYAVLTGGEKAIFKLSFNTDRFIAHGTYYMTYTYTVYDESKTVLEPAVTCTHTLVVNPYSDGGGYYNKFIGIFPNELDGILGQSWFTALVSFVASLLVGFLISIVASPCLAKLIAGGDEKERESLRKSLLNIIVLIFIIFGLSRSIAILGIDNQEYVLLNDLFVFLYAVVIAYIVWRVYRAVLDRIGYNMEHHDAKDVFDNYNSFKPLFLYLGKIIIVLVTLFIVMGMFDVDMGAIITSAGLVTLGITFGAQQVLSQFFAGLVLLSTRPFKKGDIIQLSSSTIYKVRKVKIMHTELENWDNSDITIVPNNTLTGSSVKNITKDTMHTKIYVFVSIGYAQDVDLARKLMVEAAYEHPHIVKNGPEPAPATSFIDFQASNVLLRLNIWLDDFNLIVKVGSDMRDSMFKKFKANGISIDYDQIVVHTADDDKKS